MGGGVGGGCGARTRCRGSGSRELAHKPPAAASPFPSPPPLPSTRTQAHAHALHAPPQALGGAVASLAKGSKAARVGLAFLDAPEAGAAALAQAAASELPGL